MSTTGVQAQETTSLVRGIVTSGGTPVAGAEITITNVPSGTVSRARTDASGLYSVSGLRSGGPYTVAVTSPAGNSTVTDVYAVIGQPFDLPIELAKAGTDEIVVTASNVKGAGAASDGPQTTLRAVDIAKVASVNRDIRDIERRSPFATIDLTNSRAVSFAGTNPRFNRFTIDGVQVGDTFGLNPDASPTRRGPIPFDALAQVSVSIAPFDIRQGNFQGGVVDATIIEGTNDFHGNAFYSKSTSGLQGHQIYNVTLPNIGYNSQTYGGTISGPIIKDKLFFSGSYERNTDPRPQTPGTIAQVPNLTDAEVASIQSIAKSVYNYDTGGVLALNNNLDEKFVVKLNWNISDTQRLKVSYINSYDSTDSLQNSNTATGNPQLGLASNAYKLTELLRAGIVQLNSDWSDRLQTEVRVDYKRYKRGQDPELGRGFAQFRVCTAPSSIIAAGTSNTATSCGTGNPVVTFGPDISRQTNSLLTDTYNGAFVMRYQAGNHAFKAFAEYTENRTVNAFLQYSAGGYYFDSIADLQSRNASSFDYQNALSLNPNDTTANFKYGQYTIGLQDDWSINNDLRLTYGARYDLFASSSPIPVNPSFVLRNGFANNKTFKGLQSFQPRVSFDYKGVPNLNLRGGVGVFSGGNPDIYFSNAYSNTGVLSNRIQTVVRATPIVGSPTGSSTQTCTSPYTGANAAVCTAALNGVDGRVIPGIVNNYLTTNTASLVTAPVNSVDPNFRLPSITRATLTAEYNLFGITFGADYVFTKTNNAVTFRDLRSVQIGTLPDGRPRYTFVPTSTAINQRTDTNQDIQLTNTSRGRSHIVDVRFDKTFDWGLSLSGSYTFEDVKDVSPATSSTASSLYASQFVVDPNNAAYGISNDQTKWQIKYNVGYDHAFFRDYRTTIQLFGETRAGRPFSYTFQDQSGTRSAVFGTTGNPDRYLLYVPTGPADPLVSYDNATTQTQLDTLINNSKLKNYRGQISPKNIDRSRANTRIDLHVEQEIPTFIGRSRISLFGDIENLPNLLNHNWGGVTQIGFPYTSAVVNVACLSAPVATGTAPATGVINQPANVPCAQYRYTGFSPPTESVTVPVSLYLVRVGVRFKF